jgi:hypothetical protein
MPIDIEKSQRSPSLGNAVTSRFHSKFPAFFHRSQSRELASQGFHLEHSIQSDNAAAII